MIKIWFTSLFFSAVHELLQDSLSDSLTDHSYQSCIVCTPEAASSEDEVSKIVFKSNMLRQLSATEGGGGA